MITLVEDRFDDIGAEITNNDKRIEIDLMGRNWKKVHKEILDEDDANRDLENDKLSMYILIY